MKEIKFSFNGSTLEISAPKDGMVDFRTYQSADDRIYGGLMDILEANGYDPMKMDDIKEVKITF